MLPNIPGMDLRQMGFLNNGIPPQGFAFTLPFTDFVIALLEENINYYQEACKLYIANVVLTTQVRWSGEGGLPFEFESLKSKN